MVAQAGVMNWLQNLKKLVGTNEPSSSSSPSASSSAPVYSETTENAVLVFGASGKTGREVVAQLLQSGRNVVAAVRDANRLEEALATGLQAGPVDEPTMEQWKTHLVVRSGVDITNADTLTSGLFQGVSQVVNTLGPVFGQLPEGGFGFFDNMTSERVEAVGVNNIVSAVQRELEAEVREEREFLTIDTDAKLALWERLDDVIMGGNSSSSWELNKSEGVGRWQGELVLAGGGFCGTRRRIDARVLADCDGISLRVKGDGQRYKVSLRTPLDDGRSEYLYQAGFDTLDGEWSSVDIAFSEFVAVRRGNEDRNAPPLEPRKIDSISFLLSRFELNSLPNPKHKGGPFTLEVKSVNAFKDARPLLVHMSSAGVERNARIETAEDRKRCSMPIVQLNPGGTLNWKYTGETAVRASGMPYTVVRACGLVTEDLDTDFVLQACQGDNVSGKISRAEVGAVLAAALEAPSAVAKTFELRRGDPATADYQQDLASGELFMPLCADTERGRVGLKPFPAPGPPMGMPDDERKKEILQDPRVKASQERGDGGRIRGSEEAPADASMAEDHPLNLVEEEAAATKVTV